jgi:hypothetical protein
LAEVRKAGSFQALESDDEEDKAEGLSIEKANEHMNSVPSTLVISCQMLLFE